jgi:hypothetical protein
MEILSIYGTKGHAGRSYRDLNHAIPRALDSMKQVRMTEAEVTNSFGAVLEKLQQGAEIVVEQDHRPVAIIRPPRRSGRPISACIASAKPSGSKVTLDGGFAADEEEGIRSRQ